MSELLWVLYPPSPCPKNVCLSTNLQSAAAPLTVEVLHGWSLTKDPIPSKDVWFLLYNSNLNLHFSKRHFHSLLGHLSNSRSYNISKRDVGAPAQPSKLMIWCSLNREWTSSTAGSFSCNWFDYCSHLAWRKSWETQSSALSSQSFQYVPCSIVPLEVWG